MSIIAESLDRLTLGDRVTHRNLTMFPFLSSSIAEIDYITLDEALAGCGKITEVSEGGSVPELRFVNDCERRVLLLDGEELVGAKQNRILNLSILVPAKTTILIPVSCVEAGRWRYHSPGFSSSGRSHYASGRASYCESVSGFMASSGGSSRRSDQLGLWADIDAKLEHSNLEAPTRYSGEMYEHHRVLIDEFVQAITPVEQQVGALFLINGLPIGFDLLESSELFRKIFIKLIQSYALDAIDQWREEGEQEPVDAQAAAQKLLDAARSASIERFKALGDGYDLRLHSPYFTGGALEEAGRILHCYGFYIGDEGAGLSSAARSYMARPSTRRGT